MPGFHRNATAAVAAETTEEREIPWPPPPSCHQTRPPDLRSGAAPAVRRYSGGRYSGRFSGGICEVELHLHVCPSTRRVAAGIVAGIEVGMVAGMVAGFAAGTAVGSAQRGPVGGVAGSAHTWRPSSSRCPQQPRPGLFVSLSFRKVANQHLSSNRPTVLLSSTRGSAKA